MTSSSFNAYGAVDLGALAARSSAPSRPPASPAGPSGPRGSGGAATFAVDVTEASFQADVIERSMTVPVVIDFWATWCGPCKQLSPVLEQLAAADGGRWLLARIDVDAEQRLGAAFGVQSIPSVFAVIKGQPVPLFQGALPEAQVRQYLDEVLRVAAANGVDGSVPGADPSGALPDGAAPERAAPEFAPEFDAAYDAIERGDLDAAAQAYRAVLSRAPGDPDASTGLAQVELLRRTSDLDPAAVRRAAADRPDDVPAQCAAADLDLLGGHLEDAFARLVDTVRRTSGDAREAARAHLLELFELVGPDDPRVPAARRSLARALF